MTQHDREATRHIVTDAEAEDLRGLTRTGLQTRTVHITRGELAELLDTREELKEALERVFDDHGDPDISCEDGCYGFIVQDLVSRLRGEA